LSLPLFSPRRSKPGSKVGRLFLPPLFRRLSSHDQFKSEEPLFSSHPRGVVEIDPFSFFPPPRLEMATGKTPRNSFSLRNRPRWAPPLFPPIASSFCLDLLKHSIPCIQSRIRRQRRTLPPSSESNGRKVVREKKGQAFLLPLQNGPFERIEMEQWSPPVLTSTKLEVAGLSWASQKEASPPSLQIQSRHSSFFFPCYGEKYSSCRERFIADFPCFA